MAQARQIGVRGGRDLRRALRDVDKSLVRDLAKTHKEIAEYVALLAARNAPVDDGDLRDSLKGSGTQTKARVTSRLPYSGVQEWGWPERNIMAHTFTMNAARDAASDMLAYYVAEVANIGRRAGFDVGR